MSSNARIAVVVLAAGQSRRFGASDKLLSHYNGKPLAAHVAASLKGLPYCFGAVVARKPSVAGLFKQTRLQPLFAKKTATQSDTLKAGISYARKHGASHVLLLLADMPNVTTQHLASMMNKNRMHPIISYNGKSSLPPAIIPKQLFGKLQQLQGDKGAGMLLRKHPSTLRFALNGDEALDVDSKSNVR